MCSHVDQGLSYRAWTSCRPRHLPGLECPTCDGCGVQQTDHDGLDLCEECDGRGYMLCSADGCREPATVTRSDEWPHVCAECNDRLNAEVN